MSVGIQIRQLKYLNNIIEQGHCFIKKRVRSMLGFNSFCTDTSILAGVEAMYMIKKEQIDLWHQSVQKQKRFIHRLFGIAASNRIPLEIYKLYSLLFYLCTRTH